MKELGKNSEFSRIKNSSNQSLTKQDKIKLNSDTEKIVHQIFKEDSDLLEALKHL